ncbi:FAD-dependent oxidoreductase [Fluviibacterium sp. DFM31]|uniref:FAD-dependent oxidoreductase n=1 Tax=Meridianimarinicoccus marinus TaxID=3231483 RepID=A0ABV3L750_9RHOB
MDTSIVIIGAGQAGASLALALRAEGFDGPVTLIGQEPVPPYQRPPLSKAYLMGEMSLDRLYLKPVEAWADLNVALRTGTRVIGIDPGARKLALKGGETLAYDKLALTLGAAPLRLPATIGGDLDGVFTMRDLADADAIAPHLKPGARALVVGGGYIGLEAAAVARKSGMDVTLIEAADRILGRVACPQTARWFAARHRAEGVDLREATSLVRLTGTDGTVTTAELSDGTTLDVDLVIVGIGVRPETALAEGAGLVLDNGIAVNARARTTEPGIWAAGDCASFPYRGGRIRLESVQNAIDQAEAAARDMLDQGADYIPKPWFWSDQYDVKLQIAGLNTGYDRIVARPGARDGALSHWYFAGDLLLAVDAMNDPRAYMIGKRLVDAGQTADPAAVADPATDLKSLLG